MKKRIFAFLMAMIMIVSVVPTNAFAAPGGPGGPGGSGGSGGGTGGYGTNLGWEYADVTPTYDNRGNFAGYDLEEAETHLGQYVTVTYSGDLVNDADGDGRWDEGQTERQDGIITEGSTESVTVTCASGYYIEWIVLACGHNSNDAPFSCQTVATDAGIGWQNTIATFTRVTLSMSDLRSHASHDSGDDAYYLMIEIKPLPSTVYVGYDSGSFTKADGTAYTVQSIPVDETGTLSDGATQVGTYPTWKYEATSPTHQLLGISAAAEAEANKEGYSFAGWHLTYYSTYEESSNTFSGDSAIGGTNLPKGSNVTLTIHAELVAIWQPMDTITVSKVWSDADNQDGIRPASVVVHLLRNGVHNGNPVTLNADNNWTATWKVPSKDQNGNAITWAVEEAVPDGYSAAITGDAENGFVVTNTHTPEKTSVHVQKVWKDDNNRDGLRPHGVQVQLYKNGVAVESSTATLNEANSWSYEWLDLEKYQSGAVGQANEYTVQETGYVDEDGNTVANPGYTVSQSTDAETGVLLITNSHTSATMDIPVEKVWSDSDNRDGIRPGSVTVTLTENGEATDKTLVLNEENEWKGIFEDVYVNASGTPIYYSVVEEAVAGYTFSLSGSASTGFVVTNSHTPAVISIPVTKVWNDENDQDGLRPDSITVQLYADDVAVEGKTLTLDAVDDWTDSFDNLPKYRTGKVGELIVYTAKEVGSTDKNAEGVDVYTAGVPADYTVSYSGTTITNTHTPATVNLNVEKVWSDGNNQDGNRPFAVVITLYANGQATNNTLTLNAANEWKGVWENMPQYHNGQRISYSLVETGYVQKEGNEVTLGVPEGYTVNHTYVGVNDEGNAYGTVTNTYAPQETFLNVQKVWDDDDNRAGLRPASVTVTLYQTVNGEKSVVTDEDGKAVTVELSPSNEWDHTFTGLPKYSNGVEIIYSVEETPVGQGYSTTYSDISKDRVVTITNTREAEKVSVTVNKKWEDADNQDNIRPSSVTVELYANGISTGVTKTLNADNWTATFDNLPKHYAGKEVVYTVVEVIAETADEDNTVYVPGAPDGYTAKVTGYTVTNTHTPAVISIPVTKVWDDANDQDGLRPDSITVQLYAGGEAVEGKILTLNATNNWKDSFGGLSKYSSGTEITYTVKEVVATTDGEGNTVYKVGAPDGYTAEVTGSASTGYTVTNTHTPETTTVTVTKVWNDAGDQDGERPDSITLHLYANGIHKESVEVNATSNWTYTWTTLDKYAEAKEINYTVYEVPVGNDYVSSTTRDGNHITITNKREPYKTTFTVQKVWDDANNQDNVRYDGVVVQLYANGQKVEKYLAADGVTELSGTATLTADGHWLHTWENLNLNENGEKIEYTVAELYYVNYATVDGNTTETQIQLNETAYVEPEGNLGVLDQYTGVHIITNKHTPYVVEVTVEKTWSDADNQDGKRTDSVTVQLYQNGQPTDKFATLNAENAWKATFSGLHVNHGIGVPNVYTVVEVIAETDDKGNTVYVPGAPNGYTSKVTGSASAGYTVINSHTPAVISIPVTKVWNDENDQDGLRPDSVTVQLYAGGQAVEGAVLTLDASGNWQGTFSNLPKYRTGKVGELIVYTVEEIGSTDKNAKGEDVYTADVPAGYEAEVTGNMNGGFKVTNTHIPETANLNVKKVWSDGNNQDGKRPFAVVITLYANGKPAGELLKDYPELEYQESLTLTATSNPETSWKGVWENMPRYHNGQRISYTVVETGYVQKDGNEVTLGVPEGYTVNHTYVGVNAEGNAYGTVTNTYAPQETFLNVQKVWDDDDNRAGKRPASVTVTLYQTVNGEKSVVTGEDGKAVTVELSPSNEWDHTFTGLPKYSNGVEIIYSVVETALSSELGYETAQYEYDKEDRVVTITNSRADEKVSVVVTKKWEDADNQDNIRPSSVTVELYANGIATGKTRLLEADEDPNKNWTATFENLYKHYKGKEVVYTVVEVIAETDDEGNIVYVPGAPDGYTAKVTGSVSAGYTVTNTHIPEVITIPVTKIWDDNHNQDGIRPESIVVELYADDVATGNTVTLSTHDNWTEAEAFVNLPKYQAGKEIAYTVKEVKPLAGYDASYDGTTITNTHTPEVVTVTATKVWDDDDNRDGKRPDSITLYLLADGSHTGKKIVLNGEVDTDGELKAWVAEWTGLAKFADGREIVYTVYEEITETGVVLTGGNSRVITDYTASYVHDSTDHNKITVTNSYAPETTTISVLKVWDDGGDRDGLRPESIQVDLYADGEPTGYTVELSEENGWSVTWTDMVKYRDQGQEIVYSVEEVSVPTGYTVEIHQDKEVANGMFIITNSHTPATTGVSVNKIWNDESDNDGKRPDGIIVQLYANGSAVAGTQVELNAMNNWSHVWHNTSGQPLYVFDKGEEVSYYVDEIGYVIDGKEYTDLPVGYTKTVSTKDYSTSITNTRETEKINVSVEKIWKDSDNNDGIRPATVSITLYCNGEAVNTVELNAENKWAYTWTGLYKYLAGEEAEYTVKETDVAGYTVSYVSSETVDGGIHWAVTNTHEIETKDMTVSKVWKDDNDAEGYRSDSVKVRLYKNGKVYGTVITLSADNGWKYPVTLPVYENGKEIVWTIAEIGIPKYYTATYNQKTLTVTNTIQSTEIPKTGDDSNLLFWASMMLLSCAGVAGVLFYDRKRRHNRA